MGQFANILQFVPAKLSHTLKFNEYLRIITVNERIIRAIGSKYVMVRLIAYNNERAAGEL